MRELANEQIGGIRKSPWSYSLHGEFYQEIRLVNFVDYFCKS